MLGGVLYLLLVSNTVQAADCVYDQPLTAKSFQIGVLLTWSTLSERDNDQFFIEVSENGKTYSELGSVPGAGTTDRPTAYQYLDIRPDRPISYYRLRQVDHDGKSSFSSVTIYYKESLDKTPSVVRVSDVFTENSIQLSVHASSPQIMDLQIHDLQNKLVEQQSVTLGHGLNDVEVAVGSLVPGIYRLELWSNDRLTERLTFKRVEEGTYPNETNPRMVRKQ